MKVVSVTDAATAVEVTPPDVRVNPLDGLHKEMVLLIGLSMAYGWKDPTNDSYLERAFDTRLEGCE